MVVVEAAAAGRRRAADGERFAGAAPGVAYLMSEEGEPGVAINLRGQAGKHEVARTVGDARVVVDDDVSEYRLGGVRLASVI